MTCLLSRKRGLAGEVPDRSEAGALVDRHLLTPYAYPKLRAEPRRAALDAVERCIDRHGADLTRTIHSEKVIEVEISLGAKVNGRIDLIKSLETGETAIVDFKSTKYWQAESGTKDQLSIYALGYQQLAGVYADRIQIVNLDDQGKSTNDSLSPQLLAAIKAQVDDIAEQITSPVITITRRRSPLAIYCGSRPAVGPLSIPLGLRNHRGRRVRDS